MISRCLFRQARAFAVDGTMLVGALLVLTASAGCSPLPSAPRIPGVSAKRAAAKAMSLYDTNEDEKLDVEEFSKCPALMWAVYRMDQDGDRALTAVEIAERIQAWKNSETQLIPVAISVYLDNKPLAGVQVTLDPAEFLGSSYPQVQATTNSKGEAYFKGSDPRFPGVFLGCYNVLLSKIEEGQETLPEAYTSAPVFGYEVCPESWWGRAHRVRLSSQ